MLKSCSTVVGTIFHINSAADDDKGKDDIESKEIIEDQLVFIITRDYVDIFSEYTDNYTSRDAKILNQLIQTARGPHGVLK